MWPAIRAELADNLNIPTAAIAKSIHSHPTLSEMVKDAAKQLR